MWRFVLNVDLNSILEVSPICIISRTFCFGSWDILLGPRISGLFSIMFARNVLVNIVLLFFREV